MAELKPRWPSCEGMQYANDRDSGHYFGVHYDSEGNEIADDSPMHENTTPGLGGANYDAKHYATDFKSYGASVGDKGQSPSKEETSVNVHEATRGKES